MKSTPIKIISSSSKKPDVRKDIDVDNQSIVTFNANYSPALPYSELPTIRSQLENQITVINNQIYNLMSVKHYLQFELNRLPQDLNPVHHTYP